MSFEDLAEVWRDTSCKPFEFKFGCLICGAWHCDDPENIRHYWYVEACLVRKDTYSDTITRGYGGKLAMRNDATADTMVKKFFVAARDYAEHEVRESFEYKGRRVLGPHVPVKTLWEVVDAV